MQNTFFACHSEPRSGEESRLLSETSLKMRLFASLTCACGNGAGRVTQA